MTMMWPSQGAQSPQSRKNKRLNLHSTDYELHSTEVQSGVKHYKPNNQFRVTHVITDVYIKY